MAYDAGLYARLQDTLAGAPVGELKMMGGVGFTVGGHIACGVYNDHLIVRVGPSAYADALARPHAREFDITGRPMKGWVMVAPEGIAEDADLLAWARAGLDFAVSLPPK